MVELVRKIEDNGNIELLNPVSRKEVKQKMCDKRVVVIYHYITESDGFDKSANDLLDLIRSAQKEKPGANRILFLDIEGHRNKNGGFDEDMFEIQTEFLLNVLSPYLTEWHIPLGSYGNTHKQENDVPDILKIL